MRVCVCFFQLMEHKKQGMARELQLCMDAAVPNAKFQLDCYARSQMELKKVMKPRLMLNQVSERALFFCTFHSQCYAVVTFL